MKRMLLSKILMMFAMPVTIMCFAESSSATVHTVSVANYSFTPATGLTVRQGDTVMWVWASGTHTTTSTSVPTGATTWDHTLAAAGDVFMYKATVVGTYNYQCTFHVAMGMVGSFTVVSTTNVAPVGGEPTVTVYPNPAAAVLNLNLSDHNTLATVAITDALGRQVAAQDIQPFQSSQVDIRNIPSGLYFMQILQGDMVLTKEITISH